MTETGYDLEEDTQKGKYLTFTVGSEVYGLEIQYITEIIGIQKITQMPELPEYMKGIINLRGKIIPVMDMRIRFKKEPREYNDRTCVIVVEIKGLSVGLIIDSVSEVISIPDQNIVKPPQINNEIGNRYIKGIGKVVNEVKLLIDCEKLFTSYELDDLNEFTK